MRVRRVSSQSGTTITDQQQPPHEGALIVLRRGRAMRVIADGGAVLITSAVQRIDEREHGYRVRTRHSVYHVALLSQDSAPA